MKERARRVRDFADRKHLDPAAVIDMQTYGWEYIPIHPMANEKEELERLGLKPADCTQVDCYWNVGADVVFLQVYSRKIRPTWNVGLYARWSRGDLPMLYLAACVEDEVITQDLMESMMVKVAKLDFDTLMSNCTNLTAGSYSFISS